MSLPRRASKGPLLALIVLVALILPWTVEWRVAPLSLLFAPRHHRRSNGLSAASDEKEWRERKNRNVAREQREMAEREARDSHIEQAARHEARDAHASRYTTLTTLQRDERAAFSLRKFLNPGVMERGGGGYRYLQYSECPTHTGINHQLANLRAMIEDAVLLDRIAVIPRPCLSANHNFHREEETGLRWSKYRDLDLCAITVTEDDGVNDDVTRTEGRLRFVYLDDFLARTSDSASLPPTAYLDEASHVGARGTIGAEETLHATWETVLPIAARERWRLVVRDMTGVPGGLYRRRNQQMNAMTAMSISLPQAGRIRRVADDAIMLLGDAYIAVHVRRGDRLKQWKYRRGRKQCQNGGSLREDTDPWNITRTLQRIVDDFGDPAMRESRRSKPTVYVMTDEQAAGYFEPLETKFTVRLYPFLQPMVQLHEVDNYLLYEVEKAIFESARLSVHTFANEDLGHTYYLSKCVGYS